MPARPTDCPRRALAVTHTLSNHAHTTSSTPNPHTGPTLAETIEMEAAAHAKEALFGGHINKSSVSLTTSGSEKPSQPGSRARTGSGDEGETSASLHKKGPAGSAGGSMRRADTLQSWHSFGGKKSSSRASFTENASLARKLNSAPSIADTGDLDDGVINIRLAAGQELVAGSPNYIDPIVVRGERFDDTADVFSFGVILLECLCGMRVSEILASPGCK